MTAARAVATSGLTLLILRPPAPPVPVPHSGQGDNVAHDHQGREQTARRLHGSGEQSRRNRPSEGLLEAGQPPPFPERRGRRGVPGTRDRPLQDRPTTVRQAPRDRPWRCCRCRCCCTNCAPASPPLNPSRPLRAPHPPRRRRLSCPSAAITLSRSRLAGALTPAHPRPHPPGGGAYGEARPSGSPPTAWALGGLSTVLPPPPPGG